MMRPAGVPESAGLQRDARLDASIRVGKRLRDAPRHTRRNEQALSDDRVPSSGMNHVTRQRARGPGRLWQARALAAAVTGTVLLLAYAEREVLAQIVVELVLRLAQIA